MEPRFSWASTVSGGAGKQFVETGSSGSSPISAGDLLGNLQDSVSGDFQSEWC